MRETIRVDKSLTQPDSDEVSSFDFPFAIAERSDARLRISPEGSNSHKRDNNNLEFEIQWKTKTDSPERRIVRTF